MVGGQSERIYWVEFCRDLFFNTLINSLAGRIENMLTKFTGDRKLRELENNYWTWIKQVILLQSSKFHGKIYSVQPVGYTTTCKTCSNLYAAHQAQALSWSTGLCFDPACPRPQDRHGLMDENGENNYMNEMFTSRDWKEEDALSKTKEDCHRIG